MTAAKPAGRRRSWRSGQCTEPGRAGDAAAKAPGSAAARNDGVTSRGTTSRSRSGMPSRSARCSRATRCARHARSRRRTCGAVGTRRRSAPGTTRAPRAAVALEARTDVAPPRCGGLSSDDYGSTADEYQSWSDAWPHSRPSTSARATRTDRNQPCTPVLILIVIITP